MPKKKKVKSGKNRGKRLKTSRKKKTVLEAKIDKFCADEEKYADFLKRSNLWIKCHAEQIKSLLHLTAHYSDFNFTYDDFKAGLFLEDGTLKGLNIERIAKSDRGSVICKFNCLNCMNIHESPLHFEQLVPLNTFTEGLVNIIRHKTLLWLPKISIFLSVNAESESELLPELMLSDYDIKSGAKYDAPKLDLFYKPTGQILSSDHYTVELFDTVETLQSDPVLWSKLVTENIKFQETSSHNVQLLANIDSSINPFT
ncbi:hypothetical protein Smp_017870 [Schistosoma mansoni]|uniref:hypothetical protein n=1 Tax=Schistosoma mansoni TaxID=6183 RepID=UPI00022DC9BA|nr:hypothetical protein Smp_017870 [Schistosoma mansoni]|eukprot:XP_018654854.1 hypothetical protein Smp_017870 [Schistosoma mansoni]